MSRAGANGSSLGDDILDVDRRLLGLGRDIDAGRSDERDVRFGVAVARVEAAQVDDRGRDDLLAQAESLGQAVDDCRPLASRQTGTRTVRGPDADEAQLLGGRVLAILSAGLLERPAVEQPKVAGQCELRSN